MRIGILIWNWGFLCAQRPTLDFVHKTSMGRLDRTSRIRLLKNLLQSEKSIAISDYLAILDHAISRQQALSDLQSLHEIVQKRGQGRGTKWMMRKEQRSGQSGKSD